MRCRCYGASRHRVACSLHALLARMPGAQRCCCNCQLPRTNRNAGSSIHTYLLWGHPLLHMVGKDVQCSGAKG